MAYPRPFKNFGEGRLVVANPNPGFGTKCAMNADTVGIAARQQGRARGRADRLGHVEIREPPPLPGEPVEIGRVESLGTEATDIGVTLIVRENDEDVGRPSAA